MYVCVGRFNQSKSFIPQLQSLYNTKDFWLTYVGFLNICVYFKAINGTSINNLILRRPGNGCPKNTYGCVGKSCNSLETCFCEEHCSWETCRLVESPKECLHGMSSIWIWDTQRMLWVAHKSGIVRDGSLTILIDRFCSNQTVQNLEGIKWGNIL